MRVTCGLKTVSARAFGKVLKNVEAYKYGYYGHRCEMGPDKVSVEKGAGH